MSARPVSQGIALTLPAEALDAIAERVAELVAAQLTTNTIDHYLTVEQAAQYLGCPRSRIYDLVAQRRVRHYRDGRRVLFRSGDLDAVLDKQETNQ